jgi:type IV pilus assembly protein PilY1
MVTRSASGQISYSVAQIEPGNPPQSKQVGTMDELSKPVYWLEVPRALHACRHDPTKGAACQ